MATRPVLLCVDGSGDSRHAVTTAGELTGGGPALVLHVWRPLSSLLLWNPLVEGPGPLAEAADELDAAGALEAERLAAESAEVARAAGFEPESIVVRSDHAAWSEILRLAEERDARAIALGSRGRSGIRSALLGSVSNAVVQHSERPVIVVPAPRPAASA